MNSSNGLNIPQMPGRVEDARMLTGRGCYASDWNLPNMAHAAFLRSDRAHARILGVNTAAALAMPGVIAVLTAEDVKAAGFKHSPVVNPGLGRGGREMRFAGKFPLAEDRARFVGEAVACVVAETPTQAQDAKN